MDLSKSEIRLIRESRYFRQWHRGWAILIAFGLNFVALIMFAPNILFDPQHPDHYDVILFNLFILALAVHNRFVFKTKTVIRKLQQRIDELSEFQEAI